ncbi:MAG: hypothetical protein AB7D57_13865, partial [Desulfovibrionaceae bacterium]
MIGRSLLLAALLLVPALAWGQASVPASADAPTGPEATGAETTGPEATGAENATVAALPPQELTPQEKEHLRLHESFAGFAQSWVARLNADPVAGSANVTVTREADHYVARFHKIEFRSSVVRESVSMPGNYSGLLRYWDVVYECSG